MIYESLDYFTNKQLSLNRKYFETDDLIDYVSIFGLNSVEIKDLSLSDIDYKNGDNLMINGKVLNI